LISKASIVSNCKFGATKLKRCSSNVAFRSQLDNIKTLKKTVIIGGLALIPFASIPAGLLLCLGKSKKLATTQLSKALNESESYQIMREATEKTIQKSLELSKKIVDSEVAQTIIKKSKEAINNSETYEIVRNEAEKTIKSGLDLTNKITNSELAQTIGKKITKLFN